MKSRQHAFLAAVAATALVAGAGGALAQTGAPGGAQGQGGAQMQTPAPGGGQEKEKKMPGATAPDRAQDAKPGAPGRAQDSGQKPKPGQAQQQQDQQPRGQVQQPGAKEPGQAQQRDMQTKPGQAQQRDSQPGAKQPGQAEQPSASGSKTAVQINEQQRTRISQTIRQKDVNLRQVSRNEINFRINVGAAVPRTVTLYPLPAPIVAVVPAYRGYLYIVVDGDLLIIHPQTYEIVAIIPA